MGVVGVCGEVRAASVARRDVLNAVIAAHGIKGAVRTVAV